MPSISQTTDIDDDKPVRVRDLPANSAALHGLDDPRELASMLETLPPGLLAGDRFTLKGVLGRGAQGVVLRLFDRDCGREIALKLPRQREPTERKLARFIREAQIQAQLEHPGIVPVHDIIMLPDRTVGYVMRCIDGDELRDWLKKNPESTLFDRLQIFLTACDCLAYAHGKGVIHRDLKPQNIMVGDYGQVMVCDWGLAKVRSLDDLPGYDDVSVTVERDFTSEGLAVGTPSFMSPEQAAGDSHLVDERSDIYSLGVILFELLTGHSPYKSVPIEDSLINVVAEGRYPIPSSIEHKHHNQAPAALMAIVDRAMSYRAGERYANVAELSEDLRRYLSGLSVLAYNEPPWEGAVRWWRNHRTAATTGLGVTIAAVATVALILHGIHSSNIKRAEELKTLALAAEQNGNYIAAHSHWLRIDDLLQDSPEVIRQVQRVNSLMQQEQARQDRITELNAVLTRCEEWLDEAKAELVLVGDGDLEKAKRLLDQTYDLLPGNSDEPVIDQRLARLRQRWQEAFTLREQRANSRAARIAKEKWQRSSVKLPTPSISAT